MIRDCYMAHDVCPPTMTRVVEYIKRGATIDAIKEYRMLNGVGLKVAKDAVEAIMAAIPTAPSEYAFAAKNSFHEWHVQTGFNTPEAAARDAERYLKNGSINAFVFGVAGKSKAVTTHTIEMVK